MSRMQRRIDEAMLKLSDEFGCPVAVIVCGDTVHAAVPQVSGCHFEDMAIALLNIAKHIPRGRVCQKCGDALDRCQQALGFLDGPPPSSIEFIPRGGRAQ